MAWKQLCKVDEIELGSKTAVHSEGCTQVLGITETLVPERQRAPLLVGRDSVEPAHRAEAKP